MPSKPDLPCANCGKLMWRSATSAPEGIATCLPCRRSRINHGYSAYKRGCRCGECRRANRERMAEWTRGYVAKHGEHPSAKFRRENGRPKQARERKPCGWCSEVHPLDPSGKLLSAEGLKHAQYLRYHGKPSESRELARIPAPPLKDAPAMPVPTRGGVFYSGPCDWCREQFTGWSTYTPVRLCSKRCERQESRSRRGKFSIRPAIRRAIYERDSWTCQICLGPTSQEWSEGNPWSPTLDHIVPQSATLIPDHSESNLRTCHALCNSYRGDARLSDEQVRAAVALVGTNTEMSTWPAPDKITWQETPMRLAMTSA